MMELVPATSRNYKFCENFSGRKDRHMPGYESGGSVFRKRSWRARGGSDRWASLRQGLEHGPDRAPDCSSARIPDP